MSFVKFPDGFRWGTATAAYQIEGACDTDGRGKSIWDIFSHTRGKIVDGSTGDMACDHYNRYKEDIQIMKDLNYNNYRFSISWPRVFPQGFGKVNQKGLDFYDRLVDELNNKGIEPFITLYHWDLPYELEKAGGWYNRKTAEHFAGYTEVVVKRLGDRAKFWATLNEPFVVAAQGYGLGEHAPGKRNFLKIFNVVHNLLLAHGMAVDRIKGINRDLKAGIVHACWPCYPLKEKYGKTSDIANDYSLRLFFDPIFKARYPLSLERKIRFFNKGIKASDFDIISKPVDFIGVNVYSRHIVKPSWNPIVPFKILPAGNDVKKTDMGWEIYPRSLYDVLNVIKEEYGNPEVYITENGAAFKDKLENGKVRDPERIEYLKQYLSELNRAIEDGANVKGYFQWTFMDNFEWAFGLTKRFGAVYVDYETQERIVKDSGRWYSRVCAGNGFDAEADILQESLR